MLQEGGHNRRGGSDGFSFITCKLYVAEDQIWFQIFDPLEIQLASCYLVF